MTSLTYSKTDGLVIMIGDAILPLNNILDPVNIVISADAPPRMELSLFLDRMAVEDIEALAELVRFK